MCRHQALVEAEAVVSVAVVDEVAGFEVRLAEARHGATFAVVL